MTSLRTYLTTRIPAAHRDPARLTPQARQIRSLLLDEALDDRSRTQAILDALRRDARLERDTFVWLKTILRGHYGIEYGATELDEAEQLRFWQELSAHFPSDLDLRLVCADALLLAGELDRALEAFNDCFEQDPSRVYGVGGEVGAMMQEEGGRPWLRYRMALLRQAVSERDTELVDELEGELRAEFADDAEVIAAVERALAG